MKIIAERQTINMRGAGLARYFSGHSPFWRVKPNNKSCAGRDLPAISAGTRRSDHVWFMTILLASEYILSKFTAQ